MKIIAIFNIKIHNVLNNLIKKVKRLKIELVNIKAIVMISKTVY